MTTVEKIAPNDERRAAIYLVAATAVIIALVCAVALVIYIGTKPAVSSGPVPSMLTRTPGSHPMSAAQWATAPALSPTASKARRQACLTAIDRASASRNLSSQAAIEASTNMLRICNAA